MKEYTLSSLYSEIFGTISLDEQKFTTKTLPRLEYEDGEVKTHYITDPQNLERIGQFIASHICISKAYIYENEPDDCHTLQVELSPEVADILGMLDFDGFTWFIERGEQ